MSETSTGTTRTETGVRRSEGASAPQDGAADEVVRTMIAIIDDVLAEGPGRTQVLAATMTLVGLEPSPADLLAACREVEAEHDSMVRVLGGVPGQRTASSPVADAIAQVTATRDRRIEVLALVRGTIQVPTQR